MVFRILVPLPGIEPVSPVAEGQSPNHWTVGPLRSYSVTFGKLWGAFWWVRQVRRGLCSHGLRSMERAGRVSRCLSGIAAAVWARAHQVWVSQRPVQDVHIGPHGPPSRLRVSPCAAAFHVSGSALLGAWHFPVTELPRRQINILQGKEAGVAAVL